MEIMEWRKNDYLISTDKSRMDLRVIHGFLSRTYWAEGVPRQVIKKSIEHSLCFAVYHKEKLVGFARAISDFATFAYLADVFIVPEERRKGLSKWLIGVIISHPELQGLRRFTLATKDAHGLYAQFGFTEFAKPERWMERHDPDVYKKMTEPHNDE
jgi:N-acetylglutamate synthase-like GNAT family acetyltransferase